MKKPAVSLKSVYVTPGAHEALYELLGERDETINISHRRMPSWTEHVKFVRSKPYKSWDFVVFGSEIVGSIYLSKQNEIGVFLFKKHQGKGYGFRAVKLLKAKHPRVERFLANVNPRNRGSIRFFEGMDFRHIQNTYELRRKKR